MKNTIKVAAVGDREIVITRDFDAPRRLVWEALTKPEFIRQWLFGPPGWTMTVCEDDCRVGGKFRWEWSGPEGAAMAMTGVYREVVPPERAVRTETFVFGCAPQAGEQLGTLTLTEKDEKTHLEVRVVYPSKEARDGAIASGMERGMAAGYDRLEELLSTMHHNPV